MVISTCLRATNSSNYTHSGLLLESHQLSKATFTYNNSSWLQLQIGSFAIVKFLKNHELMLMSMLQDAEIKGTVGTR